MHRSPGPRKKHQTSRVGRASPSPSPNPSPSSSPNAVVRPRARSCVSKPNRVPRAQVVPEPSCARAHARACSCSALAHTRTLLVLVIQLPRPLWIERVPQTPQRLAHCLGGADHGLQNRNGDGADDCFEGSLFVSTPPLTPSAEARKATRAELRPALAYSHPPPTFHTPPSGPPESSAPQS